MVEYVPVMESKTPTRGGAHIITVSKEETVESNAKHELLLLLLLAMM